MSPRIATFKVAALEVGGPSAVGQVEDRRREDEGEQRVEAEDAEPHVTVLLFAV